MIVLDLVALAMTQSVEARRASVARQRRQYTMQNIEVKVEGNKLVLTVDLTKEIGPSSSGKTTLLASSEGNANVPGHEGVKFGLNVYRAKK
jgi:hypothetical protein